MPFGLVPGGFLLVVTGPSGAGKGTLVERLLQARPECVFAVSSTTRPKRDGELDGVHYRFVSREQFEKQVEQGYFLEWAHVHADLYGTPLQDVDAQVRAGRVVVLDIDVQGGASVRAKRPDAVSVFVAPPSLEALRERLAGRGTEPATVIEHRMGNAPGELAQYVHYDYLVVNDDRERAVTQLIAILDAERTRVRRLSRRT
ncbi:MAG: guanylate kinase [Candidatus Eisenbacteria bacterium]|nr:guanylate kinase [Candidatus Eisenbacteria bacterium]